GALRSHTLPARQRARGRRPRRRSALRRVPAMSAGEFCSHASTPFPVLDLSALRAGSCATAEVGERLRLSRALRAALRECGFVGVSGHGVAEALRERAYAAARAFFALPEAEKRRYHVPGGGGERGYTPFRVETAKGHSDPDLKEFWHVGRELPAAAA